MIPLKENTSLRFGYWKGALETRRRNEDGRIQGRGVTPSQIRPKISGRDLRATKRRSADEEEKVVRRERSKTASQQKKKTEESLNSDRITVLKKRVRSKVFKDRE